MEIAAATLGHEIEHTTKENILTVQKEGGEKDEKEPTNVSNKIVDETN